MNNFIVTGILENHKGTTLENFRVDVATDEGNVLGGGFADKDGIFNINVESETGQQVILKFYKDGQPLNEDTNQEPIESVSDEQNRLTFRLNADPIGVTDERDNSISGIVVDMDGEPMADQIIRVYTEEGDQMEQLGEDLIINEDGEYDLRYTFADLKSSKKEKPDLLVKVYDESGENELQSSPCINSAEKHHKMNIAVGSGEFKGIVEYNTVKRKVDRVLQSHFSSTNIEEMNPCNIMNLAANTDLDIISVSKYLQAKIFEDSSSNTTAEVFYGLLRMGSSHSLSNLLSQDKNALTNLLIAAARENIINPAIEGDAATLIDQLRSQIPEIVFNSENFQGSNLESHFENAGFIENEGLTFLQEYISNTEDIDTFWENLKNVLNADKVENLRLSIELGVVTEDNIDLVNVLLQNENITETKMLTAYKASDWEGLIDTHSIEVPEHFPGNTPAERKTNYAIRMAQIVENSYPALNWFERVKESGIIDTEEVDTFVNNNPEFEFSELSISQYLNDNNNALDGLPDPNAFANNLEAMQRLYKLAPENEKFENILPLWTDDIKSAHEIFFMGKAAFNERYFDELGEENASRIFDNAFNIASTCYHLVAKYGARFQTTAVIPDKNPSSDNTPDGLPDMETLFGSMDMCSCKHCKSVFGPAAYLTDLLHWLHNSGNDLEELLRLDRREEIENIKLTCENTNTQVPYIDLVIEILENEVLKDESQGTPNYNRQTSLSADLLKAMPEYLQADVYTLYLNQKGYPWKYMPFDLWFNESISYIRQLGISLWDIAAAIPSVSLADQYARLLNCSTTDKSLIITLTNTESDIVTIGSENYNLHHLYAYANSNDLDNLVNVDDFIEQTGLTLDEITDILESRLVNPNEKSIIFVSDSCDITDGNAVFADGSNPDRLANEDLDLFHRFYRLKNKTGWNIRQLDIVLKVIKSSGSNPIDSESFIRTGKVKQLSDLLKIDAEEVIALCYTLDNDSYFEKPSFYAERFLNPILYEPEDTETKEHFETLNEVNGLDDPAISSIIRAVTATDKEEYEILLGLLDNHNLDETNLQILYSVAMFSRLIKIKISDFKIYNKLTGYLPATGFGGNTPLDDMLTVLDELNTLKETNYSFEELDYLLCNNELINPALKILDKEIISILSELRDLLKEIKLHSETEDNEELKGLYRQKLSNFLSAEFQLNKKTMGLLLDTYLYSTDESLNPLENLSYYFIDDDFIDSEVEIDESAFEHQFNDLKLLFKTAEVIKKNRIVHEDLEYMFGFAFDAGELDTWYSFQNLSASLEDDYNSFKKWIALIKTFGLNKITTGDESITSVLSIATENEFDNVWVALSELTGWSLNEISTLIITFAISNEDLKKDNWLHKLKNAFNISKRVSLPPSQLLVWNESINENITREIRATVKSKYTLSQWTDVASPLRDALRKKQRDALVNYLIYHKTVDTFRKYSSAFDLYNHFLIDTEMSPCMSSTRILFALSSVQLFISRIIMNLEGEQVKLSKAQMKEWEWRKNYRIWEANRKVFLYPENWIEPELRDNKTQYFKDLEEELLEQDIDMSAATEAYLNYLDKMDSIARIEICQLYVDEEENIVHVFARTKTMPYEHYYSKFIAGVYWTEWKKIDVKIEGEHILPVIYQNRLILFWYTFSEKAEEVKDENIYISKNPVKILEATLNWSEFRNEKWTPSTRADVPVKLTNTNTSSFMFFAVQNNEGALIIQCFTYDYLGYINFVHKFEGWPNKVELINFTSLNHAIKTFPLSSVHNHKFMRNNAPFTMIYIKSNTIFSISDIKFYDIFKNTNGRFFLTIPHNALDSGKEIFEIFPFFFEDSKRTFFVKPRKVSNTVRNSVPAYTDDIAGNVMPKPPQLPDPNNGDFPQQTGNTNGGGAFN